MAAPTYATDLTDILDFESATTLNTEVVGYTATSKPGVSSDFPIQGTGHADAEQRTTGNGSLVADNGSGVSWTSGDYVFLWGVFLAPAAVNSFANAGIEFYIGADISNGYRWTVGGNDFGRYPYGGWQNFVVDPEISTGRSNVGSGAGTTYRWFGILCNVISAISKGSPYGIDVIRYGRGEISAINGETADYATFVGMAAENDYNDAINGYHRWGLFTYQAGSYLWKGLMSLGTTTSPVDFRDSNRFIVIDNNITVNSDFNKIEINDSTSNVEWTNISFTSLGTTSIGDFEMVDNATVSMDTCSFTDMGTFIFQSNADISGTTFRRCTSVTQGGATFDGCIFENCDSTSSLFVDDLDEISNCSFQSDGSNHAIELDSNHAGGSFSLINCSYTDYATSNGSTGNEPIYNNSGGAVTINVTGGDYPYYRNGSGASTNVVQSINWYFKIVDADGDVVNTSEFRIYDSDNNQLFGVETSDGTELYSFDGSLSGSSARVVVHDLNYLHNTQTLVHPSTSNTAAAPTVIVLAVDRVYENA